MSGKRSSILRVDGVLKPTSGMVFRKKITFYSAEAEI